MLYKFVKSQWNQATVNDWTEQAKQDLVDFGLNLDLDFILSKSKWSVKNLIKAKEYSFYSFLEKKEAHSKLLNLIYSNLEMQEYLKELNPEQ